MKNRMITFALTLVMALSLAIPAGAAEAGTDLEDKESTDMIVSFFTNKDVSHIFENDGTEITDAFLAQHQSNYDAGNYSIIIQDFLDKRLLASYPPLDNGIMPLTTVNYSGAANLTTSYIYLGKTYEYTVGIKVKGTINDYNSYFQTLEYATKTSFSSGGSPAVLARFEPYGLQMSTYLGKQFVKIGLDIGGQSLLHQWRVIANAKDNKIDVYLAP